MRKILYTCRHGSGWITANTHLPIEVQRFMFEYKPLVEYVENGGKPEAVGLKQLDNGQYVEDIKCPIVQQMVDEMQKRWPNIDINSVNTSGSKNLHVMEVPDNAAVKVTEYDGQEDIHYTCDVWL